MRKKTGEYFLMTDSQNTDYTIGQGKTPTYFPSTNVEEVYLGLVQQISHSSSAFMQYYFHVYQE
jgi:hypothetical protein